VLSVGALIEIPINYCSCDYIMKYCPKCGTMNDGREWTTCAIDGQVLNPESSDSKK